MNKLYKYRFLIARRFSQLFFLFLFASSNYLGWKILMGNFSTAYVLETFYLSDPYAVLQILAAGIFGGISIGSSVLLGAVFILLFYALVGGRAFCSWFCPLNMVTDAANWLRRKLKMNQVDLKFPITRNTRYWVMGLGILMSLLTGVAAFEFVSPIAMLHRGVVFGFGAGLAGVALIFLFDLVVLKNGWCGYFCPLGAFYSTISKFSVIRVEHDKDKCTACMKCKLVCPEKQVLHIINKESGHITSGECSNCGRCIEVCDDDSLKFSFKIYKTK